MRMCLCDNKYCDNYKICATELYRQSKFSFSISILQTTIQTYAVAKIKNGSKARSDMSFKGAPELISCTGVDLDVEK